MAGSKKALGILFGVKGGNSISKDSGKLILDDLHSIVKQINSNQKLLPKVVFRLDVAQSLKSIDKLQKAVTALQNQINNINMPNGGGGGGNGGNGGNKKSAELTKLTENLKEYVKQAKELDKISKRTQSVDAMANGAFDTKSQDYAKQVEHINKLASSYQRLKTLLNDSSGKGSLASRYPQRAANLLGISVEELKTLAAEYNKFQAKVEINSEKNSKSANDAWLKNATKVSDSIHRMYDTISKDPSVKRMADRILEMTKQGSGNVDDLNAEFQRLNLKIRETGAGIETWGQKFKKAFGNHVRSALASLITLDIGQVLRGVYDNVVQLDYAVVNLQIASGKSRIETKTLVKEYAALAKQLKATTAEVSASADTWLRQGYNAAQATTLITNSTMLSKLGQMEAADASIALTSAMKGYKIAVEDSVNIVDKLTAVDMEAAASAGGIATAMAETSASANLAGVSMDTLIGYIATVKEVTQDSDESVGTFFKTMLARMGNIKVGKFVDEDGESLNDVEAVLGEVGIKLRSDSEHFRDFSEVLDEVGAKWDGYNEVQKHAIATAIAGTRQQEKFLTLMSNYGAALGYAEIAANSAGTAIDKYGAYTEGVTGKLQELKATFEEFSLTAMDSDFLTQFFDLAIDIVDIGSGVMALADKVGGLNTVLVSTLGIIVTLKSHNIVNSITSIGTSIKTVAMFTKAYMNRGTGALDSFAKGLNRVGIAASATSLKLSMAAAAVTVLVGAIGASIAARKEHIASTLSESAAQLENAKATRDERQALEELIDEYERLNKASAVVRTEETSNRLKEIQEKITDLVGAQAANLDLVNGKLETQKKILSEISEQEYEKEKKQAQNAVAKATYAYKEAIRGIVDTPSVYPGLMHNEAPKYFKELADKFKIDYHDDLGLGLSGIETYDINASYSNIDDFITQYERIQELEDYMSENKLSDKEFFRDTYKAILTYKERFGDFYNNYTSAQKHLETVLSLDPNKPAPSDDNENKIIVFYKGVLKTLEEVAPGYDALSEALSGVTSEGYLAADALSSLLELEEDGKIGGVETAKLITETAEGYKLATDALEQYVSALVNRAIAETKVNYADEASKKNAIKNLETLMSVLATLSAVQEGAPDPVDALNAEKDVLDDQLDRYKELIDLRKDLIETYADELEYQRELEKKQQKVASLQTKLTVARLDNSAAGQARVRELESQLRDAQEDLEDFTLEHAIDEILDGLDNQYSEYENFIKKELEKIEAKLDALNNPNVTVEGLDIYLSQIQTAINEISSSSVGAGVSKDRPAFVELVKAKSGPNELVGETVKATVSELMDQHRIETALKSDEFKNALAEVLTQVFFGQENDTDNTLDERTIVTNVHKEMNRVAAEDKKLTGGRNLNSIANYYTGGLNNILEMMSKSPARAMQMYEDLMKNKFSVYHEGGFVGGYAGLRGNEEFAKLMKTEFVSTPTQIQHFMNRTLPQIASGGGSAASQEFNAPLIEINCESVTSESMPMLKEIVDEAVAEVKRCLDGGMSRTGYKRTVKKLLT